MQGRRGLLSELERIENFADNHPDLVSMETLGRIEDAGEDYPVYGLSIGSKEKDAPVFCVVGGVHGLERIGSQVVLSYLNTLDQRLRWDGDFREQLKTRRIICVPVANPWGVANHRRSNKNGVDLMRNAPVEAQNATWLVGGHRISPKLPWYRGEEGAPMELENQALVEFIERETAHSPAVVALDMHSGFGVKDQIWFPFAKSASEPFPYMEEFKRLRRLFEQTYPHHIYKIEPQSAVYTTHGDIWDYMVLRRQELGLGGVFIPLTLELGSWAWVKKNPVQIFSIFGHFNPVKEHRFSRVMRRHIYFYDFLFRAIRNYPIWTGADKF